MFEGRLIVDKAMEYAFLVESYETERAPTIYAYASVDALLRGESQGGGKSLLPGAAGKIVTERPRQNA